MKKIFFISFVFFFVAFFTIWGYLPSNANDKITDKIELDFFEVHFPLKKITGPYFINKMTYTRDDNFLHHKFYQKFGVNDCYVHRDIYPNIKRLENLLRENNLRAVMYDCFRPHEAQVYMWNLNPNPLYLSNPNKFGSLHSRGIAVDISLANMDGVEYEFPTPVDSFDTKSWHNYKCSDEEKVLCQNRDALKSLMEQAGFHPIKREWWHYQKSDNVSAYPLIKICDVKGATCKTQK